jgi:hypothetical protein
MMHSSGIWGRQPVLKYLRERVLRKGNLVVDLGLELDIRLFR